MGINILLVGLCFFICSMDNVLGQSRKNGFKRVCYFGSWGMKRSLPESRITIDMIDPHLCTHLIYAFGYINTNLLTVTGREWDDESNDNLVGNFDKFNNLKEQNPRLKTLISLGGDKAGSWPFDVITENKTNADLFASNAVEFIRRWDFDGVDIDWEFPSDYRKFNLLIKAFRNAMDAAEQTAGRRYLLSAAVGASEKHISQGYDIPSLTKWLDMINLMTYDFHGSWDHFTGGNAPLTSRQGDKRFSHRHSLEWVVERWIQGGASKDRLIVGMSAHARTYTLGKPDSAKLHGVGSVAVGPGPPGQYTQTPGTMAYFEVCEFLTKDGTHRNWDKRQKFPYAHRNNQWLSFDNKRSISLKSHFIMRHGLGGAMMWSLDADDSGGGFCGEGTFPLTSTMRQVLTGNRKSAASDSQSSSGNKHTSSSVMFIIISAFYNIAKLSSLVT